MAASAKLEIIRPPRGQFLLGDVPAISYHPGQQDASGAERVPFGDATTVILPLSPARLAALSRADRFELVGAPAVRRANALQLARARRHVYTHPDADLTDFVTSQRPPTGPTGP